MRVKAYKNDRYAEYEPTHYPHPPTGMNSGMILMDLEKMRLVRYTERVIEIYKVMVTKN